MARMIPGAPRDSVHFSGGIAHGPMAIPAAMVALSVVSGVMQSQAASKSAGAQRDAISQNLALQTNEANRQEGMVNERRSRRAIVPGRLTVTTRPLPS
jgi:hypothetical protein